MRIVFLGSPEFALPTLRALIGGEDEVVGVFTQPDRPAGRGRQPAPPPVKVLALEHGLPVHQPKSISKPGSVALLRELAPDIGVIAAYGQILRQPVLDVPRLGILNVHASLLPRWRGAAPIPAAILAGDAESGATIMRVQLELDAGPMLARTATAIGPDDTTATLTPRFAEAGAALLMDVLPRYAAGELKPEPQDDALATYAPQLRKEDARIHWARDDAATIERQVRAYNPWPVAWTLLEGQPLRIHRAALLVARSDKAPGTVVEAPPESGCGFAVTTVGLDLGIIDLQPPGKSVMRAADFARGRRDLLGKQFD